MTLIATFDGLSGVKFSKLSAAYNFDQTSEKNWQSIIRQSIADDDSENEELKSPHAGGDDGSTFYEWWPLVINAGSDTATQQHWAIEPEIHVCGAIAAGPRGPPHA